MPVKNEDTWWRRTGKAPRFKYIGLNGRPLRSPAAIERIRSLVLPPAWTDVHIAPVPDRKVQAWGYDQAGRKQARYSVQHVTRQDMRKWKRVLRVARALPELRKRTNRDLRRRQLDHEKVLATVVRLICRAYFRAGSERYAVENRTFGICTLGKKHVKIHGRNLVFEYVGKRSKQQRQFVADTPLVHIIERLLELPGKRLFQYVDGNPRRPRQVSADQVNDYLYDVLGEPFTSKDLRTFGGTVRAATILADIGPAKNPTDAKRNVALVCKLVATDLGNTPAICRKAYIHPAVLREYELRGRTIDTVRPRRSKPNDSSAVVAEEPVGYYPEELALMNFLERYG
ncbi:MAG: DNA topoisomerase IB [Longimicrobiales bacterium]